MQPSAVCRLQVQVDEYKQLKESLNAASNLGQHRPKAAPQSQRDTEVELPRKDEPGHRLDQEESRVR